MVLKDILSDNNKNMVQLNILLGGVNHISTLDLDRKVKNKDEVLILVKRRFSGVNKPISRTLNLK